MAVARNTQVRSVLPSISSCVCGEPASPPPRGGNGLRERARPHPQFFGCSVLIESRWLQMQGRVPVMTHL